MLDTVLPLRQASRELVRELGFLEGREATGLPHSHCHALIDLARSPLAQADLARALRLDKSTTSRLVADLEAKGWVRTRAAPHDGRARIVELTARGAARVARVEGAANERVASALATLDEAERAAVLRGMQLYARALDRARRRALTSIRPIRRGDRAAVAALIREVMPEFGATGPGYAIHDPEVDDMFTAYAGPRAGYFVVVRDDGAGEVVVGGGGFGPLAGGDDATCELRKMYFRADARGLGIGRDLLALCEAGARKAGFRRMYLETLTHMSQARALYAKSGFSPRARPLGKTGHYGCNAFYEKVLDSATPAKRRSRRATASSAPGGPLIGARARPLGKSSVQ